jgi:hypothetical protein
MDVVATAPGIRVVADLHGKPMAAGQQVRRMRVPSAGTLVPLGSFRRPSSDHGKCQHLVAAAALSRPQPVTESSICDTFPQQESAMFELAYDLWRRMNRWKKRGATADVAILMVCMMAAVHAQPQGEWTSYASDLRNFHYSALDQITATNYHVSPVRRSPIEYSDSGL